MHVVAADASQWFGVNESASPLWCPAVSPWDLSAHSAPHGPIHPGCSGPACPSSVQAAGWGASVGPRGGCTQGPCTNGFRVSKVRLPLRARKTFPEKGHGKGPPPAVMLPAPAAASQASLASQATCMRRQLCLPEERCWATAGSPQQPDLWEGVHGVARVPGCVGRRCGLGSRIGCRGCFRVLGGSEGRDGMLGRGELFQLPASLMSIPSPLHGC